MNDVNYFVFVLGMHRSGTSCLAGSLEKCGLHLGDVRRSGRFNAKGYFEIKELQLLHDQILALNRGTWRTPPKRVLVHPYHRQALEKIALGLSSKHLPCGLKDPRLLLLLETWLELVPRHKLIGTFRHPGAVAKSLSRRNGMTEEEGCKLWLHYNHALIRHHQHRPFPLVEFDLSDAESYCRQVGDIANSLGLKYDLPQLLEFVSPQLEHHSPAGSVPHMCREVYSYLSHHRLRPADLPNYIHRSKADKRPASTGRKGMV